MQQGILICDQYARIQYFNEAYGQFIGKSLEEVRGTPITELRDGAVVPEVIQGRQPIEGVLRKEGNQEYFVNVYPIIENEEVRGSVSLITTLELSKSQLGHKSISLAQRVQSFEKQEIENLMAIYGRNLEGKKKVAKELDISLSSLYSKLNGS